MDDPFFVWHLELSKPPTHGEPYTNTRRVTVVARTLDNALRLVREATTEDIETVSKDGVVEMMELP